MFLQRLKYTDHYYIANSLYGALVGVHVLSAVVLKD